MAVSFQLPVGALDTLSYVGPPKFDFFLFRTTWEEGLVTGKIHNLSVRSWLSLQKTSKNTNFPFWTSAALGEKNNFDHQFWWKKSLQRAGKDQIGSVKWH